MILIVNDDGYDSKPLHLLYDYCKGIDDEVRMVVPSEDKSGIGNYFSNTRTFKPEAIDEGYVLDGTPVDCVRYALSEYSPDLIISGINRGYNLGWETLLHSGTFMGAREGYLNDIKSLSCSVDYHKTPSRRTIQRTLDKTLEVSFGLANLNIISSKIYGTKPCPSIYAHVFDGDRFQLNQKTNYEEGTDGHVIFELNKSSLTIIR